MYHRPLIGLKYHYVISYLTTETHPMKTRLKPLNILADLVVAEGGVLCTRSHDIGHVGSTGSWRLWKFDWNIVSSKFGEITENASYVYLSPKYSGPNGFVSKLRRSHDDIEKNLLCNWRHYEKNISLRQNSSDNLNIWSRSIIIYLDTPRVSEPNWSRWCIWLVLISNYQYLDVHHIKKCNCTRRVCSDSISLHIDGLVQERRNSIANALELRLSCTNPLIWIHLCTMHVFTWRWCLDAAHWQRWDPVMIAFLGWCMRPTSGFEMNTLLCTMLPKWLWNSSMLS